MKLNRIISHISGLALFCVPILVNASSYIPMTIDDTLSKSDIVVSGFVSSIDYVQDENSGVVYTEATIDSAKILTKQGFKDTLRSYVIRYLGGQQTAADENGNRVIMDTSVSGVPPLSIDDNIIAFLQKNGEYASPYTSGPDSIMLIGDGGVNITNGDGQVIDKITGNDYLIKKSNRNISRQNNGVEVLSYVGVRPVTDRSKRTIPERPVGLTFRTLENYLRFRLNINDSADLEGKYRSNQDQEIRPMRRVQ